MAVAYSGTNVSARGTSAAQATASISVSGTNPTLLIGISIDITSGDITVNSVTFGGTGTPAAIKETTGGTCRSLIYAVPAPSGSGVVTLNLSASRPVQIDVALFTGADQTTPCPTADGAVNSSTNTVTPVTVTGLNYAAGDGAYGCQGHTQTENCNGVTPNQIVSDSTTNVNFQDGYSTTSGDVTFALTNVAGTADWSAVTVRIQQPAAATAFPILVDFATPREMAVWDWLGIFLRRFVWSSLTSLWRRRVTNRPMSGSSSA